MLKVAACAALTASVGCNKSEKGDKGASASVIEASSATPLGAASAVAPSAPAAGKALSGLDPCLVGTWKSTRASLAIQQVNAEGGAGVVMQVTPSGASTLDFGPMSEIHAKNPTFSFDFKYSGKVTANLKTPSVGVVQGEGNDYSGLRVSATAKLPGAGSIPLFKDTSVKDLAGAATALAGIGKGLAKGQAPAAGATEAPGTPAGIDANPVFSSSSYTCSGNTLTLTSGGDHRVEWTFARSTP